IIYIKIFHSDGNYIFMIFFSSKVISVPIWNVRDFFFFLLYIYISINMSNLAEAQIYAEKRGGKVHIQTGPTTFLFSCHKNHLWERPLEEVTKRYDWCPLCPHSK